MQIDLSTIVGAENLPALMFMTATRCAAEPAQWYKENGVYLPITYAQMASNVRYLACGLIRAGIKAGDRIAILMENRPEWAAIDYAILSVGAVSVPLYCSYRPHDMSYVLNDSGAVAVFTSGGKLLTHLLGAVEHCSHLRHIYAFEASDHKLVEPVTSLEAAELDEPSLEKRLSRLHRDTLATLVYTSGTTANPKGVMLTHGNIITNLEAVPAVISLRATEGGDRMLSFLPLAHALERTGTHFLSYSFGLSVAFAERPDTVAKNMTEARPTVMITVPRMLEVVRSRILGQVAQQSSLKQYLFHLYLKLSRKQRLNVLQQMLLPLLDRLVGAKVRQRFGGRLRVLISGGAPLNVEVAGFFEALGLPVIEGYGLSEAAPLLAANPMCDRRPGSVGVAAKGVDINIADDGEILARGANIMPGYWHNRKATKEAIQDGWLLTGDIGRLDKDGYLYITGRKRDIIINSGGENIAPQRIEQLLLIDSQIDQVVVYGDQKPHLVALVVANEEACTAWAREKGLPESGWQQLRDSYILKKHLQTKINNILKPLNGFEQVRRIHLISEPFSIENDLLTPTLKIKRRNVYEQYAEVLAGLYA
ncbi:AMP-dependent synthetase/ligase [Mariprofundus ferrooxydans]|uniref:AMP-dependent synthetase/ligase n=1 Tax=Mariprofundus ferrooxydans TaxID=314344 RepID=UPI001430C7E1|nr:long-chain fatty acid--CoA ligase [Mariprofundus ferrooxydans]